MLGAEFCVPKAQALKLTSRGVFPGTRPLVGGATRPPGLSSEDGTGPLSHTGGHGGKGPSQDPWAASLHTEK